MSAAERQAELRDVWPVEATSGPDETPGVATAAAGCVSPLSSGQNSTAAKTWHAQTRTTIRRAEPVPTRHVGSGAAETAHAAVVPAARPFAEEGQHAARPFGYGPELAIDLDDAHAVISLELGQV